VAGIDLPVKLRRGLGQGKVVPAEDLATWLAPFDQDKDGEVTRSELATFFHKHRVGGPWFCEVVARTLWKFVEQKLGKELSSLKIDLVARIVNTVMMRGPRPEKRYQIDPEAMTGYKPIQMLQKPGDPLLGPPPRPDSGARPRATPPPGVGSQSQRSQGTAPGRAGSAQGASPARPPQRRPAPRRPGPRK
jgi:hypothetical protein